MEIKSIDINTVMCTFRNIEDKKRVLEVVPWVVKGAILNLKHW